MTLLNAGSQQLSLSGWTLMVGTTPISLPPGATIPANKSLTLHSASGADSSTDVYLGGKVPNVSSILQPGTRITLENPSGAPVTAFTVPNA
ncbi:MAG TPA: lamin tail domain-containing protein [Chloroflexota bacterium]|nr:lamin tail domain-containing protein [Chloroflexota bacterium]